MLKRLPWALALLPALAAPSAAQPCTGSWLRPFGEGVAGVPYPSVSAMLAFDEDGPGPRPPVLYAGGFFTLAGGVPVAGVARWDSASWSAVGPGTLPGGPASIVYGMTVLDDDGPGPHPPALYICGRKPNYDTLIARWDGATWASLPPLPPLPGGYSFEAAAIAAFDEDGPGPLPMRLFVSVVDDVLFAINSALVRWDGSAWTIVAGQVGGESSSMAVFAPDGGPPALYVASTSAYHSFSGFNVSRWDGATFTAVGGASAYDPPGVSVRAMTVLDEDGPGPHPTRLYVGGQFDTIDGVAAANIAAYDGASWSPVGSGSPSGLPITALATHDPDGPGPAPAALEAAVAVLGGGTTLQEWNGSSWRPLGAGFGGSFYSGVSSLLSASLTGAGALPPRLFAGGDFSVADHRTAHGIAAWDSTTWRAVGNSLDNAVHALLPVEGSTIARGLYTAGAFATADGSAVGIARWDGSLWSSLGPGSNNHVDALLLADTGGPASLFAAGKFTVMSGLAASHIARWNGNVWAALGAGLNGDARSLAAYIDALGPAVFAAGTFSTAGGQPSSNIARWSGASWSALGQGLDGPVNALAVYNDGSGPKLYAAGEFTHAGGQAASRIARWNGSSWSALSTGIDGPAYALTVYDDGSGPALYATGQFAAAGGAPAANIARWNGQNWSPLGAGISGPGQALSVFDLDGPGPVHQALFVGGNFSSAGGAAAANLASWNGSSWMPITPGTDYAVLALAPFDPDGPGSGPPALFAGGLFANAGGSPAPILAAVAGCTVCYANCDSSVAAPVLNISDFICFLNKYAAGDPYANCDGSTAPPAFNINDFVCFQARFAAGCP